MGEPPRARTWTQRLHRLYAGFVLGLLASVLLLVGLEWAGVPKAWLGLGFLLVTVLVYAGIGLACRTTQPEAYYVADRRVPAMYNGMATAADWMSAASFMGLAGALYTAGFGGLAFVLGWTGGFCLVAFLLAPYLRKFGQYTVPDFLGARYGEPWPRLIGVGAVILVSFTYVVAQIVGVGLIVSRLIGVAFELGVFLGLGGVLVCSFLGGMRAITWTQVAQYTVLIVAFLLPVMWLSVKQTHNPVPPLAYASQLEAIGVKEDKLLVDPAELAVRGWYAERSHQLQSQLAQPAQALQHQREAAQAQLRALRAQGAPAEQQREAVRDLARLPRTVESAKQVWSQELERIERKALPLNGMPPHARPFVTAEQPDAPDANARLNFVALVFCLVVGTAALPHILVRYYTTPSVHQARLSVVWTLFFVLLLYLTAPALAVLVKHEVFFGLVGTPIDALPSWVGAWQAVAPDLLRVEDVNADGLLQLNELSLGGDIIALAAAEIAGLPYVVSVLVAAGGMAAALSTADGLLLTVANALSHDVYYKMVDPSAPTARRVTLSKMLLLVVALAAAYVAAQRPADIVFMVSAAFSLAASAFFPALVLGIFWVRTTGWGAVAGMISGLSVTLYYVVSHAAWPRQLLGWGDPGPLWWGIEPISAGVFGVPVGMAVTVLVSLLTPRPAPHVMAMVRGLRHPSEEAL
jgi:cation/acetate symporter